MNIDDAWRILGVDEHSSPDEVRAIFRRVLRERHPDMPGGGPDAEANTRDLIAAYRLVVAHTEANVAATRVDHTASPVYEAEPFVAEPYREAAEEPVANRVSHTGTAHRQWGAAVEVWQIGTDTIALGCPADEAYPLLVDVAHHIGDVTHVDRSTFEFLEFLVRSASGDTLSVVCSLQGRSNGATEAFFTIEPLDVARGPIPAISEVLQFFVDRLTN